MRESETYNNSSWWILSISPISVYLPILSGAFGEVTSNKQINPNKGLAGNATWFRYLHGDKCWECLNVWLIQYPFISRNAKISLWVATNPTTTRVRYKGRKTPWHIRESRHEIWSHQNQKTHGPKKAEDINSNGHPCSCLGGTTAKKTVKMESSQRVEVKGSNTWLKRSVTIQWYV